MQKISDKNVDAILLLAKKFKVFDIIIWYNFYLKRNLSEHNVMWCFELSHKHSMDDLKSCCVHFLKESGEKSLAPEAFSDIKQQTLKEILKLRIWENEKPVVNACIEWAKINSERNQLDPANPRDLRTTFGEAFELIPFSAMNPIEFMNFQSEFRGLLTFEEIGKVIDTFFKREKKE